MPSPALLEKPLVPCPWGLKQWPASVLGPQWIFRQIMSYNPNFLEDRIPVAHLASASCTRNMGHCPHSCPWQRWEMMNGNSQPLCKMPEFTKGYWPLSSLGAPLDATGIWLDSIVPQRLIQTVCQPNSCLGGGTNSWIFLLYHLPWCHSHICFNFR